MQAKLAMMDHKAHSYPDQSRVPCVDRRALEERLWQTRPFIDSQGTGGGNAPKHLRSMGPLSLGWFPNTEEP